MNLIAFRRVCDVSALWLLAGVAIRLGQIGEQGTAACAGLLAALYLASIVAELKGGVR